MNPGNIYTQTIKADWLQNRQVELDVLRLDALHKVVSGNKWFKLKYYLQQATEEGCDTIATFGGAWSNHIIATAFSCNKAGLKSVGFIRGEEPEKLSPTLIQSQLLGMELIFLSREHYRDKQLIIKQYAQQNWYFVDEGGYGKIGAQGAYEIMQYALDQPYTHILAAVGTGTMLAGLIMAAKQQQVIGISSLKGNQSLEQAVKDLLPAHKKYPPFTILHQYHFGGYAKHPPELISFINQAWQQFHLPLDIVYTGKLFFAIMDLVTKKYFSPNSKLLMIHSGGLQGNNSLQKNQLSFS